MATRPKSMSTAASLRARRPEVPRPRRPRLLHRPRLSLRPRRLRPGGHHQGARNLQAKSSSIAMALTGVTDVTKVPRDIILRGPPESRGHTSATSADPSATSTLTEDSKEERSWPRPRRHPCPDAHRLGRGHHLGIPGDGSTACSKRFGSGRTRSFLQVRHEEAAAFLPPAPMPSSQAARRLPGDIRARAESTS